jgi:ankyrin repeat protein
MDPLSLCTAAGTIAISCGRISFSLINFADDVKNIDITVGSFRTEVNSLEDLLITIDTSLKAYPATTTDTNAPLWASIKRSLDDCDVTLKKLDTELDKIRQKNTRSQSKWKKSYSTVRLNMSSDTIRTLRSQIHTHVGALQMSLSCISVCLLLELPEKTSSGALQNATTVNELTAQIEGLRQNIKEVERLLQTERIGQEAMRSNIETVKGAARDLVTSATSVATLSTSEQNNETMKPDEATTEDRIGPWLSHTSESHESEDASCTSTESTRLDSIFSDAEMSLTSPMSETESIVPLPLRARGKIGTSRESRGSIASEHSSIRRREFQDDRDFNVYLSTMEKWENRAQSKLRSGDLAGAQTDLRNALDCRDHISSDSANNRELGVLQKLIEIGHEHLKLSQFEESKALFKYAVDRGIRMSAEARDSLEREIVARASDVALNRLESCALSAFQRFSEIAESHRCKIMDVKLRFKASCDFSLKVTIKACKIAGQKLDENDHDLEACDKLCRLALLHGDHVCRAGIKVSDPALIPQVVNDVVEENIDQRRFPEAESLAEQLLEYGKRLPPDVVYKVDIGRTHFNLAYACYAQRTDEKLDKAEHILSNSEQWQGNDSHLIHSRSFLLAQIYHKKGNLSGAENCAWTAMKGRMDLYSDDHENYLEVLDLFVRILQKQGKHEEAKLHAIQLTPEYHRNAAAEWCALHACYESKDEVLQRATSGGYQQAASILIEEGVPCADILRHVASEGDLKAAGLLVAAGALRHGRFNHPARIPALDHPLALADKSGRSEVFKLLLEDALSIDDCKATYDLNWAVREQRPTAIAEFLDQGAKPDRLTDGTTLLHLACQNDWLATLRALLCVNPGLEVTNSDGATPLHVAVMKGHTSIVVALLEAGAEIESRKESFTPLHLAITERKGSVVQTLLDRGASPAAEADNGINALHLAVMANDMSTVSNLLTRDPTLINSRTRYGRTALHIAIMSVDDDMACLLVDKGIDVNARTTMGNSAWDLSRRRDSSHKIFEKLLSTKMNPKPSKFKARINGALMTDPNRSSSLGIDY